jgi:hypothetical protein
MSAMDEAWPVNKTGWLVIEEHCEDGTWDGSATSEDPRRANLFWKDAIEIVVMPHARISELESDLARKTLALEWYADPKRYLSQAHDGEALVELENDMGQLALDALSETCPNPLLEELRVLRALIANAADQLDGIKYELSASVYTLEDDEFETVFHVRDILQCALKKGRG